MSENAMVDERTWPKCVECKRPMPHNEGDGLCDNCYVAARERRGEVNEDGGEDR